MSRRASDQGVAAVEFALVLPLLLMLVFVIIDFGRMLNTQERLTAAARAAALATLVGDRPDVAANRLLPGARVIPVGGCGNNPGSGATASVRLEYGFQFVTPIAVLAGIVGRPTLSATGAVPCRS